MPKVKKKSEKITVLTYNEQINEILKSNHLKKKCPAKPTHSFEIGEEVNFGHCCYAEIVDILDNYHYVVYIYSIENIRGRNKHRECLSILPWYQIKKINNNNDSIVKNKDIAKLISYTSRDIETFVDMFLAGDINVSPEYQREYIWEENDKVALIDSVFNNIDIGKIVFISVYEDEEDQYIYEILDGKQRLNALAEFRQGKFKYKGKTYEELSLKDRRHFDFYNISCAKTPNLTYKQKLQYFLFMNSGGKQHSIEHLQKIKEKLDMIE